MSARSIAVRALLLAAVCVLPLHAATWPEFKTTEPKSKRFTVINHYLYVERVYEPAHEVRYQTQAPKHSIGPEEALRSQLSAMKQLDYDWWLSTWDPRTRALIERQNKALGRDKEWWISEWRRQTGSAKYELLRWLAVENEVVLGFRRKAGRPVQGQAPGTARPGPEVRRAFTIHEGQWYATMQLQPHNPAAEALLDTRGVSETVVR